MINLFKTMMASLRNTDQPMLSYLWQAWLISWPPSNIILGITSATLAYAAFGTPHDPKGDLLNEVLFIVSWVVLALMMGAFLEVLLRLIRKPLLAAAVSAVMWGFLLGLLVVPIGVGATWAFFVCSVCFLEWKKKSRSKAFLMISLLLFCNYLATALLVVIYS